MKEADDLDIEKLLGKQLENCGNCCLFSHGACDGSVLVLFSAVDADTERASVEVTVVEVCLWFGGEKSMGNTPVTVICREGLSWSQGGDTLNTAQLGEAPCRLVPH